MTVKVQLSEDPKREVVVPLTATNEGGAGVSDYSGVPASVTFASGETEQSFTFSATDDTVDDDGESVTLGLGTLPAGVTAGTVDEAIVSITDDDDPEVTVGFEQGSYSVAEGASVTVRVELSADPEREVVVRMTATNEGGATHGDDYSVSAASVTFASGETVKSFTFSATQDTVDDDGESVTLGFGTLPAGVTAGTVDEAIVSITDDDDPEVTVSFEQGSYSVDEGASVTVRVQLSEDPEREVVVPLTVTIGGRATGADYSGVPSDVTFASGETVKSFTFSATQDTVDDDGESVALGFGTLPAGVTAGSTDEAIVSITDDDDPVEVTVGFEQGSYSVGEGNFVIVRVQLSATPGREVLVPLTVTNLGGAGSSDYLALPASAAIPSHLTQVAFAFSATQDTVDDDGESVRLGFGSLPAGVTAGSTDEATVSITDDDDPAVTVGFEQGSYSVAEGGAVTVRVQLSANPEREVVVPLVVTNQGGAGGGDYSGVPGSVTFQSAEMVRSFTFTATQDTVDDDGESVRLGFGSLPVGVTAGTVDVATVSIVDDDLLNRPPTVSAVAAPGRVAGGGVVVLDGTAVDPEGDGLSYAWSSDGGGSFVDDSALDTTWTAPAATQSEQVVTLTLTVTDDGGGGSATAQVEVTVLTSANQAPTVSAIATPARVGGGGTVSLDGTATDPEGDGLSYAWSSDGGGSFLDDSALDTTWTAPAATQSEQVVTLTLTVTDDGGGGSATAQVEVTVLTSANQAPTVSAIATPATVGGGGTVSLDGTATDPEGDALSYAWSSNGGGTFADDSALDTTWTAPAATQTEQVVTLTLTVTDDGGSSASGTVSVVVEPAAPAAPAGVTLTPSALNLTEGESGSYEVALDGEPARDVTITITAGGGVTTDPASLTFTASTWNTAQTVTVRAAHDSDTRSEDVTITHAIAAGSAPEYLALTNVGEVYVFVADDDPGVQVSPVQMTVAEGSTATYTVVLAVEPSANVRIYLRPQSVGVTGRSVLLDTYSLDFTTADWNIPQTVTIDAIHDGDGNDDVVPIRHRVASGSAGEYRNLSVDTLSVTITDADPEPAAVLSIGPSRDLVVAEGGSFTITVAMSAAHTEDVNVRVGLAYAEGLVTGTGQNKPVRLLPPYGPGGTPWATASTYVDLLFQAGETSKSFTVSVADDSVRSPAGSRRIIVGLMGANTTEVIKGTRTVVYVHAVEDD